MFLKNKNIIFKIRRSKVTDYAALSLIKGLFYIVYFHTHVHVHIEKMGNLSKYKIKLYI